MLITNFFTLTRVKVPLATADVARGAESVPKQVPMSAASPVDDKKLSAKERMVDTFLYFLD